MTIYQNILAGTGFLQGPTGLAANTQITTYQFVATGGQSTFSGADSNSNSLIYTPTGVVVTLNGATLKNGNEFTATNGTSIALVAPANAGDELNIYTFPAFNVANALAVTGGTITGNINNSSNGFFQIPVGNSSQRPAANTAGYLRYNTDLNSFEGANGSVWGAIGGASGGGSSALGGVINTNANTITSSITMTTSGQSVGPVTVANSAAITMAQGTRWVVF